MKSAHSQTGDTRSGDEPGNHKATPTDESVLSELRRLLLDIKDQTLTMQVVQLQVFFSTLALTNEEGRIRHRTKKEVRNYGLTDAWILTCIKLGWTIDAAECVLSDTDRQHVKYADLVSKALFVTMSKARSKTEAPKDAYDRLAGVCIDMMARIAICSEDIVVYEGIVDRLKILQPRCYAVLSRIIKMLKERKMLFFLLHPLMFAAKKRRDTAEEHCILIIQQIFNILLDLYKKGYKKRETLDIAEKIAELCRIEEGSQSLLDMRIKKLLASQAG